MTREEFRNKICDLLDIIDYRNGEMIFNSPEEEEEVRSHLQEAKNLL